MERIGKNGRARAIFINKLDKDQAQYEKTLHAVVNTFGTKCIPHFIPRGNGPNCTGVVDIINGSAADMPDAALQERIADARTKLTDAITETDDALLEKYLGGETLTPDEIAHAYQRGLATGQVVPVCAALSKRYRYQ